MKTKPIDTSKRRLLDVALGLIAAGTAATLLTAPRRARGADHLPKLSPQDGPAQSLNYHLDANEVDSDARKANAFCRNCTFFRGDEGTDWGECVVFPGKLVSTNGWCQSWRSGG